MTTSKKTAGYSGTPLPKKLGIKPGHRVTFPDAPRGFASGLGLDPSVLVDDHPKEVQAYDVILVFCPDEGSLDGTHIRFKSYLKWDGGLWVAWPKQSSPRATSLKEGHVRKAGLDAGLVDNKICAIDGDWSGLRFVYRREDRPRGR